MTSYELREESSGRPAKEGIVPLERPSHEMPSAL